MRAKECSAIIEKARKKQGFVRLPSKPSKTKPILLRLNMITLATKQLNSAIRPTFGQILVEREQKQCSAVLKNAEKIKCHVEYIG
jgi:hypothetical protein